ncbi:hypothetical protein NM208_g454 [Fusarium decemcellulare]|uniref:Uncharacterized protein n=1 Tax=Fusarium decemcellulare TaxID=57161 RepID=A0ACC1SZB7_9HYPO|nr:hypothetical protein NM208_g454 [Fusarium decemcellulare]
MKLRKDIESCRRRAATKEDFERYYKGLDGLIKQLSAGTSRIYNVDETRLQEGETAAHKVAGTSLTTFCFLELKEYYQQETRDWASYETSSPLQKRRLIEAYKVASEKAFTEKNIYAGFRHAGVYAARVNGGWSLDRASKRPLPVEDDPSLPATPKKQKGDSDKVWNTPLCSGNMTKQITKAYDGW